MRSSLTCGLAVAIALTASTLSAQEAAAPRTHRMFVPVVGHLVGVGEVLWKTDLALQNRTAGELTVGLTLLAANEPFFFTTMEPGQVIPLAELVGGVLSSPGVKGVLEVNSIGTAPVSVRTIVTGWKDGKAITSQNIPSYPASIGPVNAVLRGLRSDEEYRTNVGIANASDGVRIVTLALQRVDNRSIGITTIVLGPGELIHRGLPEYFSVLGSGSDLTLVAEPSDDGVVVYATILDNETHHARYIEPSFR
ncbi:MAG: hypothetical protein KY459_04495 [Acidobacteria bacterium]|nr:hypothetical protein [Acidobacteriota bacterium]